MSTPGEGNAPALAALLALQDEDSVADALLHKRAHLPERATLAEAERSLERNAARAAELEQETAGHDGRLSLLAADVADTVRRAERIDDQLRSGQAASFRDQEAMANEMGGLSRRRQELDDEQLVVMEAIEPLEHELEALADERRLLAERAEELRAALAAGEAEIDADLSVTGDRREKIAESIPVPLLAEYERLRRRLEGVAVARLVGGTCSGCHLTISASELDHFRHRRPDEVITCEQCGRILVE